MPNVQVKGNRGRCGGESRFGLWYQIEIRSRSCGGTGSLQRGHENVSVAKREVNWCMSVNWSGVQPAARDQRRSQGRRATINLGPPRLPTIHRCTLTVKSVTNTAAYAFVTGTPVACFSSTHRLLHLMFNASCPDALCCTNPARRPCLESWSSPT